MKKNKVFITPSAYWVDRRIITNGVVCQEPAKMAGALIERWGVVAAIVDGEDSAGRSKLRLQTPEELVQRAFAVAELFYSEAEARGHLLEMPEIMSATQELAASIERD